MNLEEGGYHVLVVASLEDEEAYNYHGLYDLVVHVRESVWPEGIAFDTCSFTARAQMMPRWMDTLTQAKQSVRQHGGKILYI